MARQQNRFDIHQAITDQIVTAMETVGDAQLPWTRNTGGRLARPVNVASGKPYNGVNVLSLWIAALASDFPSCTWGTYRQWQARGCQVRKGETSSLIVFYKTLEIEEIDATSGETEHRERMMARASRVFNAAQVDGFETETEALPDAPLFDPIARAERFAVGTGAQIEEGGDMACYLPMRDLIRMPDRCRFTGTETSSPAEGFYATLCHELVHWSGSTARLDRDLTGRFGEASYAMEELVAELGAAFLCADLGITPEPRADHAAYIRTWSSVLKGDKRAIFTAAAKASQAAGWLMAQEQEVGAG